MQPALTNSIDETIAAVASAPGSGARGILRISGADTVRLLREFLSAACPSPQFHLRHALRYEFLYPLSTGPASFPLAVYLWPGNRSYTGQPTAEIHLTGSPPIQEELLRRLYQLGARPARPGEFTLRSFLSGRLSLVQAEAVLGVIDANSEQQLDQALTQLAGGISQRMRVMRDQLLEDLADLEAGLDFVEEDIDFVDRSEFLLRLERLRDEMEMLVQSADGRMINSAAWRVVLAGVPNAGKSSLFNVLTGREAIVSEIQGTTTDYLMGRLKDSDLEVLIYDTAGWEQGRGGIGLRAQHLRAEEYRKADLILWCTPVDLGVGEQREDAELFQQLTADRLPCWRVRTKVDRIPPADSAEQPPESQTASGNLIIRVSVRDGTGVAELRKRMVDFFLEQKDRSSELLGSTAARCRDALHRTWEHLENACHLASAGAGDEFLSEELRGAIQELGVILGHVYTDDLLDRVFSKFCIGK